MPLDTVQAPIVPRWRGPLSLYRGRRRCQHNGLTATPEQLLIYEPAQAAAAGLTAGPVTGETVRATLARLGVRWQRATRWLASPDPAYARTKASATA